MTRPRKSLIGSNPTPLLVADLVHYEFKRLPAMGDRDPSQNVAVIRSAGNVGDCVVGRIQLEILLLRITRVVPPARSP
jgi:hypothetical protein